MIKIYSEEIKSDFEGTIIDLETVGYFDDRYVDSRRYRNIIPIIFGYLGKEGIRILCAKKEDSIPKLKEEIIGVLDSLARPFYAFNDNGLLCLQSWLKGKIENAILHNRSCLLKERDILLKRGFRKPDDLRFIT